MLFRFRILLVCLFFSLVVMVSCSSNPSSPPSGDATHRTLKITPDSSTVTPGTTVVFTLSATPTLLPKPYTIAWWIDSASFVRARSGAATASDTLSCTFTSLGTYSVTAIYTDSTGIKRDSARTIVTVNNAANTSGYGSFTFVVNHDTLDRSHYQNTCSAFARYLPNSPGNIFLGINLLFSKTQNSMGNSMTVSLTGFVPSPIAATYPIVDFYKGGGFNGGLYAGSQVFGSNDGGTVVISSIDTVNNLVSGAFRMIASQRIPTIDPSKKDTMIGIFSNVGITGRMFGQGAMTANVSGTPFQSVDKYGIDVQASLTPITGLLTINGQQTVDSGTLSIALTINTPHAGTFPFGDVYTAGMATCAYGTWNQSYGTLSTPDGSSLTITAFDPVNHRLSGNFSGTLYPSNGGAPVTITNGVLDNVTWVQE